MADELQLDYDPIEDRIVLSMRRDGVAIECLALTRRVVADCRPALRAFAENTVAVSPQLHPAARRAMTSAHHKAMASQVEKSSAPPVKPRPDGTVLVQRMACGRHRDGRWALRFELRDGRVSALRLSAAVLHAFIDLLDQRIAQAGWGVPILVARTGLQVGPPVTKH